MQHDCLLEVWQLTLISSASLMTLFVGEGSRTRALTGGEFVPHFLGFIDELFEIGVPFLVRPR